MFFKIANVNKTKKAALRGCSGVERMINKTSLEIKCSID